MNRRIRLKLALLLVAVATLAQALFAAADVPEALNMEIEMEAVGSLENATGTGALSNGGLALNMDLEDALLSDELIDLPPIQDMDALDLEIDGEVTVETGEGSDTADDAQGRADDVLVEIDGASLDAIGDIPDSVAGEIAALTSQPDDPAASDSAANAEESLPNVTTSGGADSDALFEGYMKRMLPGRGKARSNSSALSGRRRLSGLNLRLYDALIPMICEVARGERTSAIFVIGDDDAGLTNNWWTAEELGLSSLDDKDLGMKLLEKEGFNQRKIMQALLADYPYDLYWFNKTKGGGMGWSFTRYIKTENGVKYARLGRMTAKLSVSADYSKTGTVGTFELNDMPARVNAAVTNIKAIVSANKDRDDFAKLTAYAKEICDLVDYNDDAAGNPNTPYGDPWQLVFIFDGDESTNVVCEGYSKGFKYLCDMSEFEGDVACELMSGSIPGGAHMWNAVRMPDGRTYLVDLTGSDNRDTGFDDWLFMKGCTGDPGGPYVCAGIEYTYNDNMLPTFGIEWLTLSGADYGKSYTVNVSAENGMLTASPSVADAGETVTLTVNPDVGYKAVAPAVSIGGKPVNLQQAGEGTWRFTMPWGDVAAAAACKAAFAVRGFSGDYDGQRHGAQFISEDAALTIAYGTSRGVYDNSESPAWAEAGTHVVYYCIRKGSASIIEGEASVAIAPKAVGLSWGNASFIYDGGSHAPAATATGLISGDACAVTVGGEQINVGNYTAVATGLSNANYALPGDTTKGFAIVAKTVGLKWGANAFEYDGYGHAPAATATGLITGDECAVRVDGEQTNAGNYTAAAVGLSNPNYALPEDATRAFAIAPRKATLVWTNTDCVYNGAMQAPGATVGILVESDVCAVTVTGAQRDAGQYTATATALSNPNYGLPAGNAQAFEIVPKTVALTWTDTSVTYSGQAQAPGAAAVGLIPGDECAVTVQEVGPNAGSYTARAIALSNGNYALPEDATQAFVIAPKTVGLKWGKTVLTYNGKAQKPVATVTGVIDGDKCKAAVAGAKKNAGRYKAWVTRLSNPNYALPVNRTRAFRIKKKTIGLKWTGTKLKYTGKKIKPTARATGLIKGDKCAVTVVGARRKRGIYTAKAAKLSNVNYQLPTKRTVRFTIY